MTQPYGPKIALVAATYKRPEAMATLLGSLRSQRLDPAHFEVCIVVDGLDETESAYRALFEEESARCKFPLRFAFQTNAGPASARNHAARMAIAPWICIVDDDMDLHPEFLAAHLELLERGGKETVVIGRVVPERGWEWQPLYEAMRTKGMLAMHAQIEEGREATPAAFVTQNVSLSREVYWGVGGLDEDLRLGEDTELGFRLLHAGARFVFGSRAAAVHRSRIGSYRSWLERQFEYGRLAVQLYDKAKRDPAAHPLRNLVTGHRLKYLAVHAMCWSDRIGHLSIAALRGLGLLLHLLRMVGPAIATHNAIMAVAYHLGVKEAWGSWDAVLEEQRTFVALPGRPLHPS
jgi:GT2 family glycosyltransferase